MTDVVRIWFWLGDRGTAPASSVRDFCRRTRWAENAERQAKMVMLAGNGDCFLPRWRLGLFGQCGEVVTMLWECRP